MPDPKRFPWQDELDGSLSPGWALTFISVGILSVAAVVMWVNDMHMNGYGPFSGQGMMH